MTRMIGLDITCPVCGMKGEHLHYSSVNVTLDPKLKEKVFSQEILAHTCEKCGETYGIFDDILYHDMDQKLMVYFDATGQLNDTKVLDEVFSTMPEAMASSIKDSYTIRIVHDYFDMIEKILIANDGLDDRAIEYLKTVLFTQAFQEMSEETEPFTVRFRNIENNYLAFVLVNAQGLPFGSSTFSQGEYQKALDYVNKNCADSESYFIDMDWCIRNLSDSE